MPPKSAKKEPKSLWLACDKCDAKVTQSKLKSHDCESFSTGVVEEKFYTPAMCTSLPSEIDNKDAPGSYLQRFLFVPEAICVFCNFTMGSNLLIQFDGRKYVRSSWTISDKHLDEVYCTSQGKMFLITFCFLTKFLFRAQRCIRFIRHLATRQQNFD